MVGFAHDGLSSGRRSGWRRGIIRVAFYWKTDGLNNTPPCGGNRVSGSLWRRIKAT
ncbi:hypothetical protein EIKCOROL_00022 [Eikenella corrodens ATCC 23834]|uniref:Uncharacterized protein n=1 Tax=Eikenella corrodens ATCC 23834 TaxID=546274 RepID=C0DRQ5_EIKCO|nr:hypothetical protein EIKCOROL_00022 [Eikenella corrodens ATCC 23834]